MSFTPSDKFEQRWLDSPVAMKQAIHDELDDIMTLLKEETRTESFAFTNPDLAGKLTHLQTAHLETLKKLAQKLKEEKAAALVPVLERAIDDRLSERLGDLSEELKAWLKEAIKEELAKEDD